MARHRRHVFAGFGSATRQRHSGSLKPISPEKGERRKRFRLPQVRRWRGSRGSLDSHDFLAGWGFFLRRPPLSQRASEPEAEPSLRCSPRSFRPTCASPQFQWGIAPISQEASDRHPVPPSIGLLATANGVASAGRSVHPLSLEPQRRTRPRRRAGLPFSSSGLELDFSFR